CEQIELEASSTAPAVQLQATSGCPCEASAALRWPKRGTGQARAPAAMCAGRAAAPAAGGRGRLRPRMQGELRPAGRGHLRALAAAREVRAANGGAGPFTSSDCRRGGEVRLQRPSRRASCGSSSCGGQIDLPSARIDLRTLAPLEPLKNEMHLLVGESSPKE
ncbi:unnamed protein product, partial [Urochloa humidicola]